MSNWNFEDMGDFADDAAAGRASPPRFNRPHTKIRHEHSRNRKKQTVGDYGHFEDVTMKLLNEENRKSA